MENANMLASISLREHIAGPAAGKSLAAARSASKSATLRSILSHHDEWDDTDVRLHAHRATVAPTLSALGLPGPTSVINPSPGCSFLHTGIAGQSHTSFGLAAPSVIRCPQ